MIDEKTQILVFTILNLFSLYALDCAISIFLNRKIFSNSLYKLIPYCVFCVVGIFTYYFGSFPILNILISSILFFLVTLNFEGSIRSRLMMVFTWIMFEMAIEVVVVAGMMVTLQITLEEITNNDVLLVLGCAFITIISLIVIKLVQLIIKKRKSLEKISYIESFQILIIPMCSIVILFAFLDTLMRYNIVSWLIILSMVLIVFINVFFFYLFDRLKEIEELKYNNELLKSQSEYYVKIEESVNSSFDKVRTIKHDLKHQLLFLKSKSTENSVNLLGELNERLDILIGETLTDEVVDYTKNIKLNRLLNYKLYDVIKRGIDVDVKINISEYVNFDEKSMYIILGNAIDNAVENFSSEKNTNSKITLTIVEDNNNLIMIITNPHSNKLIFKNGLPITDKEDKIMHGIGLRSIKKIVDDKKGYLKIKSTNNIFSLEVVLYDEIK